MQFPRLMECSYAPHREKLIAENITGEKRKDSTQ